MRSALSLLVLVVGLIAAAFVLGNRADDADDQRARGDTLERILGADVGEGDGVDDGAWLDDWLHRNGN